jgi:hypothetical protein
MLAKLVAPPHPKVNKYIIGQAINTGRSKSKNQQVFWHDIQAFSRAI